MDVLMYRNPENQLYNLHFENIARKCFHKESILHVRRCSENSQKIDHLQQHRYHEEAHKKVKFADENNLPLIYTFPSEKYTEVPDEDYKMELKLKTPINEDEALENFNKNNICIYQLHVTPNGCIKGRIYVKEPSTSMNILKIENYTKENDKKAKRLSMISLRGAQKIKNYSGLEIVYVLWTCNSWKSTKLQEAHLIEQNVNYRIYVFTIENIFDKINVGQCLELAACYQIDLSLYRDTNKNRYFSFICNQSDINFDDSSTDDNSSTSSDSCPSSPTSPTSPISITQLIF